MRKTKEDTEISKLRILMAAEEEFCQRGFVAANMDNIAKAAGLTKGAIFWHFQNKAGLFRAIIIRATDRTKAIFREILSAPEPTRFLEKCKKVLIKIKKDNAFNVLLVLNDIDKSKHIPRDVLLDCKKAVNGIMQEAATMFSEEKKIGELRPDADVQTILITLVLIMSGFAKTEDFKSFIEPIGNRIDDESVIDAIFNGLLSFQAIK
jgi:AcrR family transcriptional regulator